jgi:hypothetical protein
MPNRSGKKPTDVNSLAAAIVGEATEEPILENAAEPVPEKDSLAVALGRRGGLKGGNARAAKLPPEQRKESAQKGRCRAMGQSEVIRVIYINMFSKRARLKTTLPDSYSK